MNRERMPHIKRIQLLAILLLAGGLFFVTPRALAGSMTGGHNIPAGRVAADPGQPGNPHGKHQHFRGTISAVDASSLTLDLKDGGSQTFSLTPATRIKIPGAKVTGNTLQAGMDAMVLAVTDSGGDLTTLMVLVIPGKPTRTHRVGTVTAYSPGSSITIQASDGKSYTFALTADTKVLPAERAGELEVGSRVTIIAPRVPSDLDLIATGIVVHPAQ